MELAGLERRINRTADMLIDMPSDTLKKKLLDMEAEKEELEIQIDKNEATSITETKLDKYIPKVKDFNNLSRKQKQIFVGKMIKNITVYKNGDVEITSIYNDIIRVIGGATPNISTAVPWWILFTGILNLQNRVISMSKKGLMHT